MKKLIEKSYGRVIKNVFKITNPIKKQIVKTECRVHKFINIQAIFILKNDGYINAYDMIASHIRELNAGAVWADQDYKSVNHFYNPNSDKGLYGFSNALRECMIYYTNALTKYLEGDVNGAMFYLGAACHLIQDITIPQHVNVKLLKNHHKYEQWVIHAYEHHNEFKIYKGGIYLNSIKNYMNYNSYIANETYNKYADEKNINTRFYKTTLVILTIAQKTTAGLMLNFYEDIEKIKGKSVNALARRYLM